MSKLMIAVFGLLLVAGAVPVAAQRGGGGGGGGGMGMGGPGGFGPANRSPLPDLPGPELEGPPDSATMRQAVDLSDQQAARYAQVYDTFMVATRPTRDSTSAVIETMQARLAIGDRAAASFYAERLMRITKSLKELQEKFEKDLDDFLSGDQLKTYRNWKKKQEEVAQDRWRERWLDPMPARGPGGGVAREERTPIRTDVPGAMDGAPSAVRVGGTVYVGAQVALDSAGLVVGVGDLRAQAERVFANLTRVLEASRLDTADVVRLTIYVVNYRPEDFAVIRTAGAAYLNRDEPPLVTVVGVQALAREGLLIAVEATAAGRPAPAGR